MADPIRNLLIMKNPSFSKNLAAMASDLQKESDTTKDFEFNPIGVIARYFTKGDIPGRDLAKANKFVLSVLANDDFRNWTAEYNKSIQLSDKGVMDFDRDKVIKDVTEAMLRYADPSILRGLMEMGNRNVSEDRFGYFAPDTPIPNKVPGGIDPTVADTWAYHETVAVAYAVAIFVVAVTQIDVTPRTIDEHPELFSGTETAQILANAGERVMAAAQAFKERGLY